MPGTRVATVPPCQRATASISSAPVRLRQKTISPGGNSADATLTQTPIVANRSVDPTTSQAAVVADADAADAGVGKDGAEPGGGLTARSAHAPAIPLVELLHAVF